MKSGDTDKSRALTWVLCLVAVPVVYLLSVPPVVLTAMKVLPSSLPPWVMGYAAPYSWLIFHTKLRGPLLRYEYFWEKVVFLK